MQETQETWVRSLDQEDPLEEEIATYSSILAWEITWTEEPGRLHTIGSKKSEHAHTHRHRYKEGQNAQTNKMSNEWQGGSRGRGHIYT